MIANWNTTDVTAQNKSKSSVDRTKIFAALWSAANATVTVVLPFAIFLVFARVVPPWQVGVITVAVTAAEALKALCPQGLYEVLVARQVDEETEGAAAGLLLLSAIAAGLVYTLGLVIFVKRAPDLESMFPFLAPIAAKILFDILALQPQARLARLLQVRRVAVRGIIGAGAAGVLSLVLIVLNMPLAAIASYYVCQSVVGFLVLCVRSNAVRMPRLKKSLLVPLLGEAAYASGVRTVGAVNNYFEPLLASAFLPTVGIAFYNLAKRFETTIFSAQTSFSSIMFQPIFASAGERVDRSGAIEACLLSVTVLFGAPIMIFVAGNLVIINQVLGAQWSGSAPLAAIMVLSGLARVYGSIHASLLSVTFKNRLVFQYALGSGSVGLALVLLLAGINATLLAEMLLLKNCMFTAYAAYLARDGETPLASLYLKRVLMPLIVMFGIAWCSFEGAGASVVQPAIQLLIAMAVAGSGILLFLSLVFRVDLGGVRN
ncbi:oligosaccharide flippase family protein [Bradyrhizobium manausense]|uniref:oligosaccharide flippase family protein n=1 Tax=Bradyrhizobium manausense TaxID=989370 RepID=UPI001BAC6EEC|nr:oligosaccharide flippase family protein [Bradyrhizobium manausense]MBR1092282.1 oligosaccharide flippase family protein [Bradyrhizobium manausense]